MRLSSRRAELLALAAFGLQLLFFLLLLLASAQTSLLSVSIEAWYCLGGAIIWLALILQFRQQRLAEEEQLDAEQYKRLQREGKETSVFDGTPVEESLFLAQRRLDWLEKYLPVIFGLLMAGYLFGMGYLLLGVVRSAKSTELAARPILMEYVAILAGLGLVGFLFSRYAVGMSQQKQWRPLRAGGSYLLSNSLVCFALMVILLVADRYPTAERVCEYVLVLLMLVIGAEIILNLLLDAYRPRIKGQYRRASYESRLLGLFSEPGGIFRTAAHAIDYQFGFNVSETWFYKLLERAVVPLIILQALALYLLSCLAIVPAGSVGVLERWGRPVNISEPYQSGLHVKLPWPIDTIRTFATGQVRVIDVGFKRNPPKIDPKTGQKTPDLRPILWTQEHWQAEYPFLVAVSRTMSAGGVGADDGSGVGVTVGDEDGEWSQSEYGLPEAAETETRSDMDLLVLAFTIHYRISDISKYCYNEDSYLESDKLLECICYNETLHYAAQWDIDRLMGPGRDETTRALYDGIRQRIEKAELGVEIVFVGLESVHPPIAVAPAFEDVVGALQHKQAEVLSAQGEANRILSEARGLSSVILSRAEAYRMKQGQVSKAQTERFEQQLKAYDKGKDVYLWREYLSVLDARLPAMRKYIIASDKVDNWVYQFDLTEQLEPDLLGDLGIQHSEQENTQ